MGDTHLSVRVQGFTQRGSFTAGSHPQDVRALVDTGAAVTVLSARTARAAGVVKMRGRTIPVTGVGGTVEVPVGLAVLRATSCDEQVVVVGISDAIADAAGVEAVLGHDYMQRVPLFVTPRLRRAGCPPPATKDNPSASRRRSTSPRRCSRA